MCRNCLKIAIFQLVVLPLICVGLARVLFRFETWRLSLGTLLLYMTNTGLDAIDTLVIVKTYRRALLGIFGRSHKSKVQK